MSKRVAIIGAGVSGQAAARYWLAKGAEVTMRDRLVDVTVPEGALSILGTTYLKGLNGYDLIVRSPGIRPRELKTSAPITTGVREFFRRCPARIIGITGTNGKIVVAQLVAKILEEAGRRAWVGGDGGMAPLDLLGKVRAGDFVVLSLSSFQLMDLDVSPAMAVCLSVVPERSDWHGSTREYVAALGNIFWHQQDGDVAIYDADSDFATQIAQLSPGRKIGFMQRAGVAVEQGRVVLGDTVVYDGRETTGRLPLENVCAAVTAGYEVLGGKLELMQRAIVKFEASREPGDVA